MIAVLLLILGVLLGAFILIPQVHKSGGTKKVESTASNKKVSKIYSKADVLVHNKKTDCWIIIKDKVYDVTSYVEEHPGGDAILAHAGDDSTEGFYGPQHATRVFDMIDDFYIGDLER
ncbi:cytochrome B5-like protein [Castanea sativa]|uniref:cytochrome B5-like protein n=1 Tax=Castanea sativa TaxID=21020 RepID=UPI003ADB4C87